MKRLWFSMSVVLLMLATAYALVFYNAWCPIELYEAAQQTLEDAGWNMEVLPRRMFHEFW